MSQCIRFFYSLPFADGKIRVGVVSYANEVFTGEINPLSDIESNVTTGIWSQLYTQQFTPGTVTGQALKTARTMLLADELHKVKAILVVTDGASTNYTDTVLESRKVRLFIELFGLFSAVLTVKDLFIIVQILLF